jgi:hypothetical protein
MLMNISILKSGNGAARDKKAAKVLFPADANEDGRLESHQFVKKQVKNDAAKGEFAVPYKRVPEIIVLDIQHLQSDIVVNGEAVNQGACVCWGLWIRLSHNRSVAIERKDPGQCARCNAGAITRWIKPSRSCTTYYTPREFTKELLCVFYLSILGGSLAAAFHLILSRAQQLNAAKADPVCV